MTLPLFLDLTGRKVVLVGGGSVAARRARTFLSEGALLTVISPALSHTLLALADSDPLLGNRITFNHRGYGGPADLEGAWLVHTSTGDPAVDRQVARDAEELRIWCVNATEATTTAAAVAARTTVETPQGIVTVATHAGGDPGLAVSLRDSVATAITQGHLPLQRTRPREHGWVALVGGGPGADGLLTARGHELLASADVVVLDRLAPQGVVQRLPEGVDVIDVGKVPGRHAVSQEQINQLLIDHARRGRAVVRLKGGDSYVLGRGVEERQACEAAGIEVEVVPGVTSAVAVPAAAGIPVTHRGLARGFTVVTGHDEVPTLPTGNDHTLVLLMAVTRLAQTTASLISHGRTPSSPVAIIEHGFSPQQRTTVGTLDGIAERATALGVSSPAVVVVGDVVRLSPHWTTRP